MEILVAEHSGFCEGVERAFRIALETARAGKPVYMLGNLVHNKQVVERLKSFGVKTVSDISEISRGSHGTLLISAHGVAPEIFEAAKKLKLEIVDTTCPWVKKAQKIAKELSEAGRLIILVGDKGHPEVKGIVGWSGGKALVVENLEDLRALDLSPEGKLGVLAQTTQAEEHFDQMVAELKNRVKEVEEFDTICGATTKRQNAAVEIAKKADLMLVIGDRMSANTKRLTELCAKTGTETHQIETAKGLDLKWLKAKRKIGITAGASTPEWVIAEVKALLRAQSERDKNRKLCAIITKAMKKSILLVLSVILLAACADAAKLYRIRFGYYPEKIRAALDFNEAFNYQLEESREKIIIHLPGAEAGSDIQNYVELSDIVIRYFEVEKEEQGLKITIPLAEPIPYNIFSLNDPPRLVIDFDREFTNLVSGGTIIDGVESLRVSKGTQFGRVNANVLKVDLTKAEVAPALARKHKANLFESFINLFNPWKEAEDQHFYRATVGTIAEEQGAVAAVNGTYFAYTGKPLGTLLIDKELVSSPIYDRTAFILTDDNQAFIDNILINCYFLTPNGIRYNITGVNQGRGNNSVILYTPVWGDRTGTGTDGIELVISNSTVKEINIGNSTIPQDSYVLSLSGPAAQFLTENLKVGDKIDDHIKIIPYSTSPKSILHMISGGPRLVKNGMVYVSKYEERFRSDIAEARAARTAVGITKDNKILLATVDGLPRQKNNRSDKSSIGMTLEELSNLMINLGAVEAMNLDGGSSTTMWIDGRVVNRTASGYEQRVSNAIVIRPRI